MPEPVALHGGAQPVDPVEVPEVLFISALLDTGAYLPGRHRIVDDQLVAYERVHAFCCDYQTTAGAAPDIDLVRRRFPDFPYVPGIHINWAAKQLAEAAYGRDVRRATQDVLRKLSAGDLATIPDAVRPMTASPVAGAITGLSSLDAANAEIDPVRRGIPVPYPTLQEATGGICKAEMWFIGARYSTGKTYTVSGYAARAAEHGCTVKVLTTEMPAWSWNRRVNLHFARTDPALQAKLRSADKKQRFAALDQLSTMVAGRVETIDLRATPMNVSVVAELCVDAHLVVIDHVGHLRTRKGIRASDDWRMFAEISQDLMETKNITEIPILGSVQVNRAGETTGLKPPKSDKLGGTDQLGQDADVIVMMARPNKGRVMVHSVDKGRDVPEVTFYSTYDPTTMDFEEISFEQAKAALEISKDPYGKWGAEPT